MVIGGCSDSEGYAINVYLLGKMRKEQGHLDSKIMASKGGGVKNVSEGEVGIPPSGNLWYAEQNDAQYNINLFYLFLQGKKKG